MYVTYTSCLTGLCTVNVNSESGVRGAGGPRTRTGVPLRLSGLGGTRACHLQSLLTPVRVKPGPPGLFEMLSCTHDIIDQPPGLVGLEGFRGSAQGPHLGTLTLDEIILRWGAVLGTVGSLHTRCRSTFLSPPCDS